MDVQEEKHWIGECLAGHSEGYRPLVEACHTQIRWMVVKMTGRPDIADDIAQEAFVRAYTKLHTFRGESRFATWVTQIAIRLCHDLHREEHKWHTVPIESVQIDGQIGTDEKLAMAERDQAVTLAMQKLPPHYREVLVLRYCEGHSLEEIAHILGRGLSAVKMTVHRGVEMLRQELDRESL